MKEGFLEHIFATYIAHLGIFTYPLIGVAIFLEGEAVIFGVMFLAYEGLLNIYSTVTTIVLSVLFTDISSYAIGYYGPTYLPRVASFYEKIVTPMDNKLRRMSFIMFLISKFTYGFHRAVLIRSGMLRLPFWKFFRINILTSTIWIVTISLISYASWQSVHIIQHSLRYVERALALGVILLLIGSHTVAHFSKRKLLSSEPETK